MGHRRRVLFIASSFLGIDRAAYLHHSREGVVDSILFSGFLRSFFFGVSSPWSVLYRMAAFGKRIHIANCRGAEGCW